MIYQLVPLRNPEFNGRPLFDVGHIGNDIR